MVAASAIQPTSTASATLHGLGILPATTSVKAISSLWNASANRSMKKTCGVPSGKVEPGSVERIGQFGPIPAATLSCEPCTSSRTSWPRALYREFDTTASVPDSRVRTVAAVSTSLLTAKTDEPWFEPTAYTSTTSWPVTNRTASKSCTLQSLKMPPDVSM